MDRALARFGIEGETLLLPIVEEAAAEGLPDGGAAAAGAVGLAESGRPVSPEEVAPAFPPDSPTASSADDGSATPLVQTLGDEGASIILSADLRDADRVLDVQEMIASAFATTSSTLSATGLSEPKPVPVRVAPYAQVRRRMARYRIPRSEKRRLLDGFCGLAGGVEAPRTLLVIAHPDDESIGAGARLAELGEAWVAYVTDGSPRNVEVARRHGFETREQYAEERQREALAALGLAGIGPERVSSLGIVDGEASLNLVELCLRTAELFDRIQPSVVVTHPYEGGHTDHDATAFAVHLACGLIRREGGKPPTVLEMTSYNAMNGDRVVQEFLPHRRADLERRLVRLGREKRLLKQRMYACFETQQRVLREFSTDCEKFRPAPRYVFTRPPHEGVLNYERYGDPDLGRRFRAGAEEALRELRVRGKAD